MVDLRINFLYLVLSIETSEETKNESIENFEMEIHDFYDFADEEGDKINLEKGSDQMNFP